MRISYIFKAWPDADTLKESSKEELALLIFLYENGAQEEAALCEALELRPARSAGALRCLEELGLIQRAEDGIAVEFSSRAGETFAPQSGKAVAATIRDHALAALLEECAALLGKPVLERWEIEDITCLYEQYGLGEEFIVSLLADMRSRSACSVKALVNRAIQLHKQGIDSHEALMHYFEEREEKGEYERMVRRVLGIRGRLSGAERVLFEKWVGAFGFGEEMIGKAYDLTTMQLSGRRDYRYMDTILTNWYNAGIFSPAEADAASEKYKSEKAAADAAPAPSVQNGSRRKKETPHYGNFDTMDAFQRALERSYGADGSEEEQK